MGPDKGQFNRATEPGSAIAISFVPRPRNVRASFSAGSRSFDSCNSSQFYVQQALLYSPTLPVWRTRITSEFAAPCSQAIRTSPDIYYLSDVWSA